MADEVLRWTPALSLGIEEIDQQHQALFMIFNHLVGAIDGANSQDELEVAFLFLQDYVVQHFFLEEEQMRLNDYDGLEDHVAEHEHFVTRFIAIKREFTAHGASAKIVNQLKDQLGKWLVGHVAGTDMKLAAFLMGRRDP